MRDLILGFLVEEDKRGRYGGSNPGANYDSANNTRKVFLDIGVPLKKAKSLKNTSEGVHPS